ncbi:MAG: glycosyltransferase, partial [Actinomycetota bacterium]|nr:glycosyltransferase [Actinomycetota bacterium]
RLAIVGPLPPARTGIATYNARLAERMTDHCELDYFAEHEAGSPRGEPAPYRRFSAGAFARRLNPASYDAVFYTFGNSANHHQAYQLAMWYPGIAWFHDVQIAELYLSFGRSRMNEDATREHMRSALLHQYGERAPEYVVDGDNWKSDYAYELAGVRLCTEVVAKARAVVVTSELARSALTLDAGPYNLVPRTWVVPLAVSPPAHAIDPGCRDPGTGSSPPVIVTLGTVAPVKQPEVLLAAMAAVNLHAPARLTFVGHVEDQYRDKLCHLAAELGITHQITFTGFVKRREELGALLAPASGAVQLRMGNSGAASTGIADALAHGLAVLTNASAAAELPSGTVQLVGADVTAGSLALDIRRLLDDADHRDRLGSAALDYASSHTLDDAVEAMLEVARWHRGGQA